MRPRVLHTFLFGFIAIFNNCRYAAVQADDHAYLVHAQDITLPIRIVIV
jgi:hypothetical protein